MAIAICFGLATGFVGRAKGSSFWIWFAVGSVLPFFGLIAVALSRDENTEPERASAFTTRALRLSDYAADLSACAALWRRDALS